MAGSVVPQTRTVMEAGFTLREGTEAEFWRANNGAIPTAAAQPGFVAVVGGPIANSSWLYFSGTWETPDTMDQWYWSPRHKPVQDRAFSRWFASMYIRKWRLPADGERLDDRIFCQTEIRRSQTLPDAAMDSLIASLRAGLPTLNAAPFETLTGEFEPQPFQLVGPVEELPETAPVKYLVLTHWRSAADVERWFASPTYEAVNQAGEVSSEVFVAIRDQAGTRPGLRPDGLQRDWTFDTGPWKSLRTPVPEPGVAS
jgi:Antibiotic biosynthesis monooxygenase